MKSRFFFWLAEKLDSVSCIFEIASIYLRDVAREGQIEKEEA